MATGHHEKFEYTNYARLCKLLIDVGTRVLREMFDKIHPPELLEKWLLDPENKTILEKLIDKESSEDQWRKLYPNDDSKVNSSGFDIMLLHLLLQNICKLEKSAADDLKKVMFYRYQLYTDTPDLAISNEEFSKYWDDLGEVLLRLGGPHHQEYITELKDLSLIPDEEKQDNIKNNDDHLKRWVLSELRKTENKVIHKMNEKNNELSEKINQSHQELQQSFNSKIDVLIGMLSPFDSTPASGDSRNEVYAMKNSPRGLLVIINIEKFQVGKLRDRKGSEKDVHDLKDVFSQNLQFKVLVINQENTERLNLLQELRCICDDKQYEGYDCLACCIMSHGNEDFFYSADGQQVNIKGHVISMFTNSKCAAFCGKPKLFFIQACRGDMGKNATDDLQNSCDGYETECAAQSQATGSLHPDMSDILIHYASFEGYAAFRFEKGGSLYIQSLVKILRGSTVKEDIMDLLTRVNNEVHRSVHGREGRTQVSEIISTLTKKLYLRS